MLRGNRGIITKIAGLAVLGLLSAFVYALTVPYSRSLQQEAANQAKIHRQHAEDRIEWVCFSPSAKPDCVEETRRAERESERQEYDLAAQRMSAWWAQVMGVAALIGMALSAVGVWLVKTTFDETRKANHLTRLYGGPDLDLSSSLQVQTDLGNSPERRARINIAATNRGNTAVRKLRICNMILRDENGNEVAFFIDTLVHGPNDFVYIAGYADQKNISFVTENPMFLEQMPFDAGDAVQLTFDVSFNDVFGDVHAYVETRKGPWVSVNGSGSCNFTEETQPKQSDKKWKFKQGFRSIWSGAMMVLGFDRG